jgi:hypothetical protein
MAFPTIFCVLSRVLLNGDSVIRQLSLVTHSASLPIQPGHRRIVPISEDGNAFNEFQLLLIPCHATFIGSIA